MEEKFPLEFTTVPASILVIQKFTEFDESKDNNFPNKKSCQETGYTTTAWFTKQLHQTHYYNLDRSPYNQAESKSEIKTISSQETRYPQLNMNNRLQPTAQPLL